MEPVAQAAGSFFALAGGACESELKSDDLVIVMASVRSRPVQSFAFPDLREIVPRALTIDGD
jgi:hypothetical protein